jgi:spore coat polysaccharide biosynthesis protein SpsF
MMSKVVCIIQARMGSTRLPGKVLQDLGGATVLARTVNRMRLARALNEIVVATTIEQTDDAIVDEADRLGVPSFRGSEDDVLDRYYHAALNCEAQVVVRVTSDCPLVDPCVADEVIDTFRRERADYASNTLVRTYPRGLDVEVMTMEALADTWRNAVETYQRTHVTPYLYENPDSFRLHSVTTDADYSGHRWTVDTIEDLEFIRALYADAGSREDISWKDLLMVACSSELPKVNRDVRQKSLREG